MPTTSRSQRVHELGLKLTVLLLVTVGAFVGTRAAALQARQRTLQDAALLHRRGVAALAAGNTDLALENLRRASVRDRGNPEYGLAFARALAANGQVDAAHRALLSLREEAPDHPVVNLELARIAAMQADVPLAIRYYRYALYAPWPDSDGPRQVREELVRFLLDHQDRTHAVSELVAARATTPDEPAAHLHLGQLFLQAAEPRLALEEFRRALQIDRSNGEAHRLAGDAEYRLENYAAAARDFTLAGELAGESARRRDIARAVVTNDPLAARLPAAERLARGSRLLAVALDRLDTCAPAPEREARRRALEMLRQRLRRSGGRDASVVEETVDAAAAEIQRLTGACDLSAPAVEALRIIGRRESDAQP